MCLNYIQILILNRKTTTIKQLKLSLKRGHKNYFYSSRSTHQCRLPDQTERLIIIKWYIVKFFYCNGFTSTESIKFMNVVVLESSQVSDDSIIVLIREVAGFICVSFAVVIPRKIKSGMNYELLQLLGTLNLLNYKEPASLRDIVWVGRKQHVLILWLLTHESWLG